MPASQRKTEYHMASRVQRLDPRRECRFLLALIMLIGCATLSVLATTHEALSRGTTTSEAVLVTQ